MADQNSLPQAKTFHSSSCRRNAQGNDGGSRIELVALLNDLSHKYKVDEDRICVTGLSMGGYGTWRLASYAPDRLAAIAPICGGGEKSWGKQFPHLPVWAFHGAKDTGVPPERSQVMVDELKKKGGNPKLTIYPEAEHDSWTETYDNPKLYEWLLEQKEARRSSHVEESKSAATETCDEIRRS